MLRSTVESTKNPEDAGVLALFLDIECSLHSLGYKALDLVPQFEHRLSA